MTETTRTRKAGLDAEAVRISRDAKELRASMKGKEMNDRTLHVLISIALVLAWVTGFIAGWMICARYTDASEPTARETQIERYEEMGR